jgi:hypothetical protein
MNASETGLDTETYFWVNSKLLKFPKQLKWNNFMMPVQNNENASLVMHGVDSLVF